MVTQNYTFIRQLTVRRFSKNEGDKKIVRKLAPSNPDVINTPRKDGSTPRKAAPITPRNEISNHPGNTTPRNEMHSKTPRHEISTPRTETMATTVKYKIIVLTGDVSGAGTDANVLITLYGEKVCEQCFS